MRANYNQPERQQQAAPEVAEKMSKSEQEILNAEETAFNLDWQKKFKINEPYTLDYLAGIFNISDPEVLIYFLNARLPGVHWRVKKDLTWKIAPSSDFNNLKTNLNKKIKLRKAAGRGADVKTK